MNVIIDDVGPISARGGKRMSYVRQQDHEKHHGLLGVIRA